MMQNNTVTALRNLCYQISGPFNELHLQVVIILKHYVVSEEQFKKLLFRNVTNVHFL